MSNHGEGQHDYLEGERRRERPSGARPGPIVAALLLLTAWFAAVMGSESSPPRSVHLTTLAASEPSPDSAAAEALTSGWNRSAQRALEARSRGGPATGSALPANPGAATSGRTGATGVDTANRPPTTQPSLAYGCSAAYAWLQAHAAPGFRFICPGNAMGHQAMTCEDVPGICPGAAVIVIAVPCPAAYMNEAHNSWIAAGLAQGSFDPYGYCQ